MSIQKKLLIIMSFILVVFVSQSSWMLWINREAHLQIHSADATLNELFAILQTRATMVAHTTRALDYFVVDNEQGKKVYFDSEKPANEAYDRWLVAIQERAELGENEEDDLHLAREVKRKYNDIKKVINTAFELYREEERKKAYDLLEGTVEQWVNHVLTQEIDAAETIEVNEMNMLFDKVLSKMGAVPWGTRRALKQIRIARVYLEYLLRADRLLLNISLQYRELMDYLISADETELGEIEEHWLDVEVSLQALNKAFEVHDEFEWRGTDSFPRQRVAELEIILEKFHALSSKAIALKKAAPPEQLIMYVDKELIPFVNEWLFESIEQEIFQAHDDIDQAIEKLLTVTTRTSIEGIILVGLVFSFISLLVYSLVQDIISPLKQLTAGTKMIAQGHMDHRINLQTADELGLLAQSFDRMSESLQVSQNRIVKAKEYTDNILRTMCDTLMVVSPTGTIKTVNQALCLLLDYESQELLEKEVSTILLGDVIFEGQVEKCVMNNSLQTYLAKGGRKVPVLFSSSAMLETETGDIEGIVCVAQDMTQRLKDRQAKERLERRLMVSEKLATMSQLAAGLAHEIRNPLASIDVNLRNLVDEWVENNEGMNQGQSKYISMIANEVTRLNIFLEKFVHSMVPHETELQSSVYLFDDIVQQAMGRVQSSLDSKKGSFKFISDSNQLYVECDQERLAQALTNILQNGVDAMFEDSTITIACAKREHWAEVTVTDSGVGLSQQEIDKVFDFYFSTKKSGMGVGLPLAQLIIEQHEGSVAIESDKGKGTSVIVKLPIKDNYNS